MTPSALSCCRRVVCALLWCVRPVSVCVCLCRGLCVGRCWPSAAQTHVCLLGFCFFCRTKQQNKKKCAGACIKTNRELKHTRIHNNREQQIRSMRERAHSKQHANSNKQNQCAGARIQKTRELKQTRSMRWRAHSNKLRTQANTFNVRPRAFKNVANSIKQCQ